MPALQILVVFLNVKAEIWQAGSLGLGLHTYYIDIDNDIGHHHSDQGG